MKRHVSEDPLAELAAIEQCWCHVCAKVLDAEIQFMILCPICGCKRCPHATNHQHRCTGSNTSGQIGSVYGLECTQDCCRDYWKLIER